MEPSSQQPTQPNPYDFITNPTQEPRKPIFGGSMKSRILIIGIGIVLLIVLSSIVMNLLSSGTRSANQALKGLAAQQQEIVRIAELGVKGAVSITAKSFATTTKLAVTSSQQELTARLTEIGLDVSTTELNARKDSDVDSMLEAAAENNRHDEALTEVLSNRIHTYLNSLRTSHDQIESEKTKTVLSNAYTNAATLIDAGNNEQ